LQLDMRTVAGVGETGAGAAAVLGGGVDIGTRAGNIYVGGSVDAAEMALMTPGGWGGSLLRAGVELRGYLYDQPGVAASCFGLYPVRRELYVGACAGVERAEDAYQNEDVGGFGELTLGGAQVRATGSSALYLTVGASAAPGNGDAANSPATSMYATTGIQLTFG
jgi:hypothetical protein